MFSIAVSVIKFVIAKTVSFMASASEKSTEELPHCLISMLTICRRRQTSMMIIFLGRRYTSAEITSQRVNMHLLLVGIWSYVAVVNSKNNFVQIYSQNRSCYLIVFH